LWAGRRQNRQQNGGPFIFDEVPCVVAAAVIVVRVLGDDGSGRSSDLHEAVDWVVAHAQTYAIVAVNPSLGFGDFDQEPTSGFLSSPFKALADSGVAIVAASGNGYAQRPIQGVACPSSDPWAISVGAV
jgi:subtilase family serine protease